MNSKNNFYPISIEVILLLTAIVVFFYQNISVPGLFMDGVIYAALGKNALLKGHWLVPHLAPSIHNQFFEHPPLFFISEGIFFKLFGVSWSSARLHMLVYATLTISIFWWYLRKISWPLAYLATLTLILTAPYMKDARSPNLDIMMTLFIMLSLINYFAAFSDNQLKKWLWAGFFFGVALLVKGPPALIIPLTIVTHLLLTKNIALLKRVAPWIALLLGFLIFAIWPLALHLIDNFNIFEQWINKQFLGSIEGRNRAFLDPFRYVRHLLKFCAPWFIATTITIYFYFKNKIEDKRSAFFIAWFLSVLLPYSAFRWKLSHYIIPLFPPMAYLSALSFMKIEWRYLVRGVHGINFIIITLAFILIITPFGSTIRRDKELFKTLDLVQTLPVQPTKWITVDSSLAFWSFAPTVIFATNAQADRFDIKQFKDFLNSRAAKNSWIFIIKTDLLNKLKGQLPQKIKAKVKEILHFSQKNITILLTRYDVAIDGIIQGN